MNTLQKTALQYAELGLSVVPTVNKEPTLGWKKYQNEIMRRQDIAAEFALVEQVGIICGKVSGNLEIVDVDCKHDPTGNLLRSYQALLVAQDRTLLDTLVIESTISHGLHLIYRCPVVGGNQKLAKRPDGESLIETRGEGGLFVAYPSPGYQLLKGSFEAIPCITPEQRLILLDCARSLNEFTPLIHNHKPKLLERIPLPAGLQPGDDYDSRGEEVLIPLLESHGWTVVGQTEGKHGTVTRFKRPGESDSAYSAHYNFIPDRFYVWSTSTVFEAQVPYKPYAVFAILECEGDFTKAANQLYEMNYGERTEPEKAIKPKLSAKGLKMEDEKGPVEGTKKDSRPIDKIFAPAQEFLDNYYTIRQNEITLFFEDNNQRLEEKQLNGIYVNMRRAGLKISYPDLLKLLNNPDTPTFHPLKEFFDINHSRLGEVSGNIDKLINCILPEKPAYNPIFIKKWLVGMVATLYATRSNVLMLVLTGPVNTGKSSFFENLLPAELMDYYAPSKLDQGKDSDALMCSKLLILNDELDGMSNYEAKTFRNFVSATRYTYRPPYGEHNITRKRLATVCGTSNDKGIIADFENNRRIIPIAVEKIDFKKLESINKVQLMVEAYREFESGYQWELTHDDIALLAAHTAGNHVETVEAQILPKYFKIPKSEIHAIPMTNGEIMAVLAESKLKIRQKELGMALREMGFKTSNKKVKKSKTSRQVYWVQKITIEDDIYQKGDGDEPESEDEEDDVPF